ncbi:hypothetical protein DH2020_024300 [Rehmannia glutinosa]|uniref:Dof zinc finger protein n=1 Tax=Rehmannia glutinosa TaxID=99300 RepID=A0ABR0W3M3_REHGL
MRKKERTPQRTQGRVIGSLLGDELKAQNARCKLELIGGPHQDVGEQPLVGPCIVAFPRCWDPLTKTMKWKSEMSSQTLESMLVCTKSQQDKKPRPTDMQALKCPRCDSSNTNFCYYNNYSLSQPRYFCKSCRRYWTKADVAKRPGRRRLQEEQEIVVVRPRRVICYIFAKRNGQDQPITSIPSSTSSLTAKLSTQYDSNDLSLAFARLQKQNSAQLGIDGQDFSIWGNPNMPHHHGDFGVNTSCNGVVFDALRSGFLETTPPNGIQNNLYYGNLEMENNGGMGMGGAQEMGMVKQEMCNGGGGGRGEGSESRVLWGFPWQSAGGDGNVVDFDSSRLGWSGIGSSNWHGLLNSPLM